MSCGSPRTAGASALKPRVSRRCASGRRRLEAPRSGRDLRACR
jgi:hypothetical protein